MGLVSLLKGKKAQEEKSIYFPGLEKTMPVQEENFQTNEQMQQNIETFFNSELINIIRSSLIQDDFNDPSLITDYYLRAIDEKISELEQQKIDEDNRLQHEKDNHEKQYLASISEIRPKMGSKISEKESLTQKLEQNKVDRMNIGLVSQLIDDLEAPISSYRKEINQLNKQIRNNVRVFEKGLEANQERFEQEKSALELAKKYPLIDLSFMNEHQNPISEFSFNKRSFYIEIPVLPSFVLKLPRLTPFKYGSPEILRQFGDNALKSVNYSLACYNEENSENELAQNSFLSNEFHTLLKDIYSFKNIFEFKGSSKKKLSHHVKMYPDKDYLVHEGFKCEILFKTYFNFLIPEPVKEKIEQAKKYFGDEIYILAETDWELKRVELPKPVPITVNERDPIFIGIKDFNSKPEAYFITAFLPSVYENYVINQNVGNKPGKN